MKIIQNIGFYIFLACLVLFFTLLGLGKYQLTENIIREELNDQDRYKSFLVASSDMQSIVYNGSIRFVKDLSRSFARANEIIEQTFGITNSDLDKITSEVWNSPEKILSQEVLDGVFSDEIEIHQSKKRILSEYLGWYFDKPFHSNEELTSLLYIKSEEINKAVIDQKGFNKYFIDDLKFSLTKASTIGLISIYSNVLSIIVFLVGALGALMYYIPKVKTDGPAGIKNNKIYQRSATNRGLIGIVTGTLLILFYVLLYWYPWHLTNWVILLDPLSRLLNGYDASRWFLYGFLYTLAMLVMGVRMIIRYRHNRYQLVRTYSVLFFQLGFAFLLPEILVRLNQPYMDFKNMWPLDYDFFFNGGLLNFSGVGNPEVASVNGGAIGMFMLVWGIVLFAVGVPVLTFLFGKRFYCSWVCGCGGLAETVGDPYRHLSDKSLKAWKVERYLIYSVLVFVVFMTILTLYTFFTGKWGVLGIKTNTIQSVYGFVIGAAFAGVVGTGFYPFMGNRVWCRFGCPLAGYIGIIQRFKSRFRITTNGGQCISCGNCSTYCEMGIDVRWYAQRGQNIVRSSCVGCGICSAVCPRGVLRLENGPAINRTIPNGKVLVDVAKDFTA